MAQVTGHTPGGEIAIILTASEVAALETAIRESMAKPGSDVRLLQAVEEKIREAKGKML
jgi:hypothetical protein